MKSSKNEKIACVICPECRELQRITVEEAQGEVKCEKCGIDFNNAEITKEFRRMMLKDWSNM